MVFYGHLPSFYQSTEPTSIFTISEKPLRVSPHGPWKLLPLATSKLMPPIIQKEKYHSNTHLTWKIARFAFADVALGYWSTFCGPGCISVNWANHFLRSEKFASVVLQKAFREAMLMTDGHSDRLMNQLVLSKVLLTGKKEKMVSSLLRKTW